MSPSQGHIVLLAPMTGPVVPLANVPALIGRGNITSGTTLAALLYVIASGH